MTQIIGNFDMEHICIIIVRLRIRRINCKCDNWQLLGVCIRWRITPRSSCLLLRLPLWREHYDRPLPLWMEHYDRLRPLWREHYDRQAPAIVEGALRQTPAIVEGALRQTPASTSLPNPENLARRANSKLAAVRPRNPDDLQVLISNENIPDDFMHRDESVGDRRHILFATDRMLDLLAQTKHWYDIVFWKWYR